MSDEAKKIVGEEALVDLRKQIDGLDRQIQTLINERVGIAGKVALTAQIRISL